MRFNTFILTTLLLLSLTGHAQQNWQLDTAVIGKIKQIIAIKGKADAPLLLFLHGGPGSSRMRQADSFSNKLQEHFLVVQWDQRETGKTLAINKTDRPITLDLMVNDTRELINYLLKKFERKQLYLAGESWGTVLGFSMAKLCPEKIYAYLAFVPVTDQTQSEELLRATLIAHANAKQNTNAKAELSSVKIPFENAENVYYLRKWWFDYEGKPIADKDTTLVKNYLDAWSSIWLPTWQAAMAQNLSKQLPKVKCPVYFFLGGKDYQTNSQLAKNYYQKLSAPKKNMFWFEEASHDLLISEAPKVQQIIIEQVLEPGSR